MTPSANRSAALRCSAFGRRPETLTSALDIWVAERDGERSWSAPVEVDVASHDALLSCPTSITDNGCLMTVRHFELGVGTAQFSLARR